MRDMGRSDDPRVQAQLDRLGGLSIQRDTLGLDAVRILLDRIGNPHTRLPPTFHVAGTNGKGSTCAFLRAMLEAQGYTVHVTTSPHLVRYNERFRIAGKLIEDARLAELLEEVFDAAEGLGCSFFEITVAAAFAEFARVPADACVVEVGLGGRLDATNVLEPGVLAACGIAALGIDHERFLLAPEDGVPEEPMARIAFEKAGIAKNGVPLVTLGDLYPPEAQSTIQNVASQTGAPLHQHGPSWLADDASGGSLYFFDFNPDGVGTNYPLPNIPGAHQAKNAALAIAMIGSQSAVPVSQAAIRSGLRMARWPARLQTLSDGPLTVLVPERKVILDGGHNLSAGKAIAQAVPPDPQSLHLIIGMLDAKDTAALTGPLGNSIRSITAVPIEGYDCHPASAFGPDAKSAVSVEEALLGIPSDGYPILIAGSLYLAGEVLRANDEVPD